MYNRRNFHSPQFVVDWRDAKTDGDHPSIASCFLKVSLQFICCITKAVASTDQRSIYPHLEMTYFVGCIRHYAFGNNGKMHGSVISLCRSENIKLFFLNKKK